MADIFDDVSIFLIFSKNADVSKYYGQNGKIFTLLSRE